MRTTVRLPDELYTRVRRAAGAEGETLTAFLERALREALDRHEHPETRPAYRVDAFSAGSMQPGVDLDDSSALLDAMDSDAGR